MGTSLYLVVKDASPLVSKLAGAVPGKALARAIGALDALANAEGLPPLLGFFSVDPAAAAELLGDAMDDLDLPAERWARPADGLQTVRGLLASLKRDPKSVRDVDGVVADLVAIEAVLVAAEREAALFHMAMDV